MKKSILLYVPLVLLLITGCKKYQNETDKNEERIEDKYNLKSSNPNTKSNYEKLRNAGSAQEAKVIFNTLSTEEAAEVWKYRLVIVKESNEWTTEQNEIFDLCINDVLSSDFYETDFFDFRPIEQNIKVVFSDSLAYKVFSTFEDIIIAKASVIVGGISASCECSTESDWCGFGETGGNRSKCVAKQDCGGGRGCGTLWRYSCSGHCTIEMK